MSEDEFMDPVNWSSTGRGNPTCEVVLEDKWFKVILFCRGSQYGFLIVDQFDNKTWSRNSYSSEENARRWAWFRLWVIS